MQESISDPVDDVGDDTSSLTRLLSGSEPPGCRTATKVFAPRDPVDYLPQVAIIPAATANETAVGR